MVTDGRTKTQPAGVIGDTIELPSPSLDGKVSVEAAMNRRRSVRTYRSRPLGLGEVSQILFAAQGVTGPDGMRTAPSAGSSLPLEVHAIVANVNGLTRGVYHYIPEQHAMTMIASRDPRRSLRKACGGQECIAQAPFVLVITGFRERLEQTYGELSERLMMIEVGHVSQNVYLQCASINLGTVVVGAFEEQDVRRVFKFSAAQRPLALMPVGHIT